MLSSLSLLDCCCLIIFIYPCIKTDLIKIKKNNCKIENYHMRQAKMTLKPCYKIVGRNMS